MWYYILCIVIHNIMYNVDVKIKSRGNSKLEKMC